MDNIKVSSKLIPIGTAIKVSLTIAEVKELKLQNTFEATSCIIFNHFANNDGYIIKILGLENYIFALPLNIGVIDVINKNILTQNNK